MNQRIQIDLVTGRESASKTFSVPSGDDQMERESRWQSFSQGQRAKLNQEAEQRVRPSLVTWILRE